jgi:acyl-CoA reductase-like NAD-dependent aldehyde dehydrogenase
MTVQRKLPLHVAGREIFDGETFRVVDPYDATASLNEVVSADENIVQLACDSALEAFATWRNTSIEERRKVLVKAADVGYPQSGMPKYQLC